MGTTFTRVTNFTAVICDSMWLYGERTQERQLESCRSEALRYAQTCYSGSSLALLSPDWSLPMPSSYFVLIS